MGFLLFYHYFCWNLVTQIGKQISRTNYSTILIYKCTKTKLLTDIFKIIKMILKIRIFGQFCNYIKIKVEKKSLFVILEAIIF